MSLPARRAAALLVAAIAIGIGPSALFGRNPEASREDRLGEVFSYYLKEGGVWRQDNADHQPGSDSPVAYIKRYQWGPGRSIVLDDTFALMESGECTPWAHNVFNWDTSEKAIRAQVFHLSGAWFSGLVRVDGEHRTTADLTGVLPDGKELRMRDRTDRSDPHKAAITAFFADGETWKERDQVFWTQVTTPQKPCGF